MTMVLAGYYCTVCDAMIPEEELQWFRNLGHMHKKDGCRSGRVTPIWRKLGES